MNKTQNGIKMRKIIIMRNTNEFDDSVNDQQWLWIKNNKKSRTANCLNLIDFLTTTIHSIYQWASLRELASNERILLYIFFLSFFFVIKTNTKYTAKPDMHVEQRNCDSCVWRCVLCACLLCIDRLSLTTTTRERQRQLYIYNWRRRRTSLINHTISVFTLGSVVLFFREISSDGATQSGPFFCLNIIFVKELVGPFSGNASHLELTITTKKFK